jgi:hypothetical protein
MVVEGEGMTTRNEVEHEKPVSLPWTVRLLMISTKLSF